MKIIIEAIEIVCSWIETFFSTDFVMKLNLIRAQFDALDTHWLNWTHCVVGTEKSSGCFLHSFRQRVVLFSLQFEFSLTTIWKLENWSKIVQIWGEKTVFSAYLFHLESVFSFCTTNWTGYYTGFTHWLIFGTVTKLFLISSQFQANCGEKESTQRARVKTM